ncbi:PREDICTED: uncharacterized protein LOC109218656 [Nicotiana attenuata]|uniref:uncharacterized protein LOC109218656 n=1 Tax=Nicotiana attenuata TaxID=49451 RepID=UPI0009059CAD|nr:PREDICTED: uncharacterized protein LOC109218656 [Nicotiana attenuata]
MRKILEARQTLLQVQIRKGPRSLTKQIYEQLLPSYPKVPWKCVMYKNDARPKAKFIMWLQLQDKLLTTHRLAKWGIVVDLECVMCHTQPESGNHLFMECDFTKVVWNRILLWLQKQAGPITGWDQHVAWIIQNAKRRTQQAHIFRSVYAEYVYAIWMESN